MDEKIRSEIQALTANNHYRQYPASKAQLARLSDLDDDPDDDPEEDYEADPADEALDRLIDEVAALEQRRFEEAGLAEMAKEMAEEIAASELRPLKAFEHLASPDTLRRAAWQGRLVAEKIGRDWFTDEYAVRAYLKHTRARRQMGQQEQPIRFVNLTPHAITVRRQDGTELSIPASGQVARCEEQRAEVAVLDGIAISTASYGAVEWLPEPQPGTFYIVSGLVLAAVGDRRADVFAPGPAIRDDAGRIVACDGLSAGTAFAGRR